MRLKQHYCVARRHLQLSYVTRILFSLSLSSLLVPFPVFTSFLSLLAHAAGGDKRGEAHYPQMDKAPARVPVQAGRIGSLCQFIHVVFFTKRPRSHDSTPFSCRQKGEKKKEDRIKKVTPPPSNQSSQEQCRRCTTSLAYQRVNLCVNADSGRAELFPVCWRKKQKNNGHAQMPTTS